MDICLQLLHVKILEVITLVFTTRKKLNKQKISDTYWTHQRIKIVRQTIPLHSRETGKYRKLRAKFCLSGVEGTRAIADRNTSKILKSCLQ